MAKFKLDDINSKIIIFKDKVVSINELLVFCTENNCSDLYVKVGTRPYIFRYGKMIELQCMPINNVIWDSFANFAISSENNAKYVREKMLDFAYSVDVPENSKHYENHKKFRYRVSAGFSEDKNAATFRMITPNLPSFSNINFPSDVSDILRESFKNRSGIIVFCGPTGSGKSVYENQELQVLRENEFKKIYWRELKVGDTFEDNSSVISIEDWDYRKCFILKSKNSDIIVSDDHLIKCILVKDNEEYIPVSDYLDTEIQPWISASEIYESLNSCDFDRVILISNDTTSDLDSIELYKNGEAQKVRCITTDTGEYKIGNFVSHNTTSMAACISDFTKPGEPLDNSMIITLEDPIEYVYNSSKSVRIMQKELGRDFKSYQSGIKQALREHPTLIICGEMRDAENIIITIEAARTGHKVLSTFHVSDVPGAISRLDAYLSVENKDLIYDLIANIDLIICQRISSSNNTFIMETQYLFFVPEIVKYLQNVIHKGENVSLNINKLFKNKDLLDAKIIKDWS